MAWKAKTSGFPDVPDKGAICAALVGVRRTRKKREKKRDHKLDLWMVQPRPRHGAIGRKAMGYDL
jgi:hypothetical protein